VTATATRRQAVQATTVDSEGVIAGAVLREARRALRLRQDQIAERLFVDIDTYRSWEHGRRSLTRIAVHRYKALIRGLLDVGVPTELVDALDVAVDVDLAIGRALVSEENPFPPVSKCPMWHELLAWAVIGTVPEAFERYGVATAPRMATTDRNRLLRRIRVAVDKPKGLDVETLRLLGRVYLGNCPTWCSGRCKESDGDPRQHGELIHTTADVEVGDVRARMTQTGVNSEPQIEIAAATGRLAFSLPESALLGSALLQLAREGASR